MFEISLGWVRHMQRIGVITLALMTLAMHHDKAGKADHDKDGKFSDHLHIEVKVPRRRRAHAHLGLDADMDLDVVSV